MKSINSFRIFYEFFTEQLGDERSVFWKTYVKSLLLTTYIKLNDTEKKKLLKLIKTNDSENLIKLVEETLSEQDYSVISKELNKGILSSIE